MQRATGYQARATPLGLFDPLKSDRIHRALRPPFTTSLRIDFDAGAEPPVEEVGVAGATRVVTAQFVEHPVLERLPEQLAARLQRARKVRRGQANVDLVRLLNHGYLPPIYELPKHH